MKDNGETKGRSKLLIIAVCVAFALEFAGCKGGSGGAATTEPPGTAGTNGVATNAMMSADTNTTTASTTNQ
jgi:hypothetical protein